MKTKLIALLMIVSFKVTCQNINYIKDSTIISAALNLYSNTIGAKKTNESIKDSLIMSSGVASGMDNLYYINDKGEACSEKAKYFYWVEGNYFNGNLTGLHKFFCPDAKNPENLTLVKEMTYKDDTLNGPFKYFFPDGRLAKDGNYLNGKIEGVVSEYFPNGKKSTQCSFKNGDVDGQIISYYQNGSIKSVLNSKSGKPHGSYIKYYPNGKDQEEWNYIDGKAVGRFRYYHENGVVWVEREFKNNLLWNVVSKSDSQGNPLEKGTLKDGNGTEKYYNEFNELYLIETYKDGILIKSDKIKTKH